MFLEIISPESILFSGEIELISVPGISGYFQILENHAPIISSLKSGTIIIKGKFDASKNFGDHFKTLDNNSIAFNISSGTIEMKNNKLILLSE